VPQPIITTHYRGRQTSAREGILCGAQGSHTYIDSTYLEAMLKLFYRLDYNCQVSFHTFHSKPHFYSTGSDYCYLYFVVAHVKLFLRFQSDYRCNICDTSMRPSIAIKSSMWPSVENVCPPLHYNLTTPVHNFRRPIAMNAIRLAFSIRISKELTQPFFRSKPKRLATQVVNHCSIRTPPYMGVRRNFSRGLATSTFRLSCSRC